MFRVLQARVTFGNIFALDSPVTYVSPYKIDGCLACEIDTACFDVPDNYVKFGKEKNIYIEILIIFNYKLFV